MDKVWTDSYSMCSGGQVNKWIFTQLNQKDWLTLSLMTVSLKITA